MGRATGRPYRRAASTFARAALVLSARGSAKYAVRSAGGGRRRRPGAGSEGEARAAAMMIDYTPHTCPMDEGEKVEMLRGANP